MAGRRVAKPTEPRETTKSNSSQLKQQMSDKFLQLVSTSINCPPSEAIVMEILKYLRSEGEIELEKERIAARRDVIIMAEILFAILLMIVLLVLIYPRGQTWTLPVSTGVVVGVLKLVRRFLQNKGL